MTKFQLMSAFMNGTPIALHNNMNTVRLHAYSKGMTVMVYILAIEVESGGGASDCSPSVFLLKVATKGGPNELAIIRTVD